MPSCIERAGAGGQRRLRCHFRSLHFAKMLLHVAAVTVLVNIALIELDSFYSPMVPDADPSPTEVRNRLRERRGRPSLLRHTVHRCIAFSRKASPFANAPRAKGRWLKDACQ